MIGIFWYRCHPYSINLFFLIVVSFLQKNKKSREEEETMSDHLARAEDFESRADKKLSGWGLFGSKYEDASDLFDKAANAFKLAKSCTTK